MAISSVKPGLLYELLYSKVRSKIVMDAVKSGTENKSFFHKCPKLGAPLNFTYLSKDKTKTIEQKVWKNGSFDVFVFDENGILKTIQKRVHKSYSVISTWDFKLDLLQDIRGKNIVKVFNSGMEDYFQRVFNKVNHNNTQNVGNDVVELKGVITHYKDGKAMPALAEVLLDSPYIRPSSETKVKKGSHLLNDTFNEKILEIA